MSSHTFGTIPTTKNTIAMEQSPHNFTTRPFRPGDLPFLREMLYEAVYWRPTAPRPPIVKALAQPHLAKLLDGWGRQGDTAVIAIDSAGAPIGAAWYRFWSDDDHSYGYVVASIPELAIGVVPTCRGQGVGKALINSLLSAARSNNVDAISLSVEQDNFATKIYYSTGFREIARQGNALTMVWHASGTTS